MIRIPNSAVIFALLLLSYAVLVHTALSCTSAVDCTNEVISNQSKYVSCVDGSCVCDLCFTADVTGMCTIANCYSYNYFTDECTNTAPRWLAALIMSILIGGTGAANFYISRYKIAISQLMLFCIILTLPCIICCVYCCTGCDCGDVCRVCGLVINLILAILLLVVNLCLASWWIADLVIFSLNDRKDGNGCSLVM
ncbi:hypothetical protein LOD99_13215 [Oopsacas minuta]|uniref:Uncharacterized protein n=1 Tax=Oopsacas minuta TaxID=111878 RepID=A0AAV7JB53_9METZ|nr:hypothetical protein LOD99_13215 [Oopsacas minuta]